MKGKKLVRKIITFMSIGMISTVTMAETSRVLEEIIVTAQKTEQSLQDVPVSLMAVSGSELNERNINELTQLTLAAPTLQVGQDNTFAIRGIGSQIQVETVDQSVGLALDGVSLGRNALAGQPFNDVSAVEVLNGPQGLLFGKNASSGLVNITTNKPVIGEYEGSVGIEYLVRDSTPNDATGIVTKGTLNIPMGENSALRINALISDQESLIDNVFPNTERVDLDQERSGIKAKYLFEDGPLSVYLIADYNEDNGTGGRLSRTFRTVGAGSEIEAELANDNIVPGPNNFTNNSDGTHFRDLETGGLQGTISYELENGMELINIAAWRYFESDQNIHSDFSSLVDIDENPNRNDYSQLSNELRLVWPTNDKFSGQAGLYYFESDSEITDSLEVVGPPPFVAIGFPFCVGAQVTGPPPGCPYSNDVFLGSDSVTDLDATSMAVFGQFDFFVSEDFTVTAGARVTKDEVTSNITQSQLNYFVPIGGPRGTFEETVDNTNFSWKLGGQYDVNENVMAYASVGQGYKAPGFNPDNLDDVNIPFAVNEEVSTTVEAGFRSQLLNDRLIFNASVFNTSFDDYQSQTFDLTAQAFILQNAAEVTARGAEVSVTHLASDNLTLFWDVALLDATFDEYGAAPCTPDNPLCAGGNSFFDASGFATPLSADVTSTLQFQYERELENSWNFFMQGSMYYRSEMNYGIGSPDRVLGSVDTYNLSAGVTTLNGMRLSVFCKNCTDEKVPTAIGFDPGDNNRGFASAQQTWGLDSVRAVGVTASFEF